MTPLEILAKASKAALQTYCKNISHGLHDHSR